MQRVECFWSNALRTGELFIENLAINQGNEARNELQVLIELQILMTTAAVAGSLILKSETLSNFLRNEIGFPGIPFTFTGCSEIVSWFGFLPFASVRLVFALWCLAVLLLCLPAKVLFFGAGDRPHIGEVKALVKWLHWTLLLSRDAWKVKDFTLTVVVRLVQGLWT